MDCTVSIIIPVYNVRDYLRQCLDSVLNQTWSCLDVILIDDGSTDGSESICDEYAKQDSRVRVIHQVNAGAANAKNAGLAAAKGDYIAFADSDDWVEPDWIENMLRGAVSNDADVVECGFCMEYADHREDVDILPRVCGAQEYLRGYPERWSCALFWNKLFRAKRVQDIRFHTERRCVDDEFFTYKAITGANRVACIGSLGYHYRQRASSVTQSEATRYQRTIDDIDILGERYRWMKQHYPQISKEYLRHDVDSLLYFFKRYPFNEKAICRFRETARFYFVECIKNYPGKVTMYYSVKALLCRKKDFLTVDDPIRNDEKKAEYYP